MRDQEIREALNQHWAASDSGDFATEHDIYQEDPVLDYPQSRKEVPAAIAAMEPHLDVNLFCRDDPGGH